MEVVPVIEQGKSGVNVEDVFSRIEYDWSLVW